MNAETLTDLRGAAVKAGAVDPDIVKMGIVEPLAAKVESRELTADAAIAELKTAKPHLFKPAVSQLSGPEYRAHKREALAHLRDADRRAIPAPAKGPLPGGFARTFRNHQGDRDPVPRTTLSSG